MSSEKIKSSLKKAEIKLEISEKKHEIKYRKLLLKEKALELKEKEINNKFQTNVIQVQFANNLLREHPFSLELVEQIRQFGVFSPEGCKKHHEPNAESKTSQSSFGTFG